MLLHPRRESGLRAARSRLASKRRWRRSRRSSHLPPSRTRRRCRRITSSRIITDWSHGAISRWRPAPTSPVLSGSQPVVVPFINTKSTADVLLAAAALPRGRAGGELAAGAGLPRTRSHTLQSKLTNLLTDATASSRRRRSTPSRPTSSSTAAGGARQDGRAGASGARTS